MTEIRILRRGDCELHYPKHLLQPRELIAFLQMDGFAADWDAMGFDVAERLSGLEACIMAFPDGPAIIPGTGGLRRVEFCLENPKDGEAGVAHVYYAYFERYHVVLLVLASDVIVEFTCEQLADIRDELDAQSAEFEKGPVRFKNNVQRN